MSRLTGNLVATFSRRTLLLASCSLSGVLERSYAQAIAMIHIILLGDSVFDNAAYVDRNPDVVRQLGQMLPQGRKATLLARDGAVISEIGSQLRGLPSDATHLVISVGGNDALHESGVLESSALSVADALTKLTEIGDGFGRAYGSMLTEVSRVGLPTAVCTIYEPRFPEAPRRKLAATALTLLNDKITRQTFARGLTLIDLRLICNEDADFANPIEPSARGGAKIAQAISKFAGGATPRRFRLDFDGGLGGEAEETALFLPVMRQVFAQSQQPARFRKVHLESRHLIRRRVPALQEVAMDGSSVKHSESEKRLKKQSRDRGNPPLQRAELAFLATTDLNPDPLLASG